jgi:PiT family inorganic phosphate transporter
LIILIAAALFLAFANGANDNFKGVATLYGSYCASYRTALAVGTAATLLGSFCSLAIASELVRMFSGSGVVPADVAATPVFATSVAAAAAITVMVATAMGLPVSTTHGLIGAIIGAGWVAVGWDVDVGILGRSFVLPLLLSPVLAICLTVPLYYGCRAVAGRIGVTQETCVCLDGRSLVPVRAFDVQGGGDAYATAIVEPGGKLIVIASADQCIQKYAGRILGVRLQSLANGLHFLSASCVSFARGLNDTPKIAGLLLVLGSIDMRFGIVAIGIFMAVGGFVSAARVAATMSRGITTMNDGQALTANLVTSVLVVGASWHGLPVSTTQVAVGSIAGVGVVTGTANAGKLKAILWSWLLTLPIACVVSIAISLLLRGSGF